MVYLLLSFLPYKIINSIHSYHNIDAIKKQFHRLTDMILRESIYLQWIYYKGSAGFTIIELMLAMAIIGVLATIATPNIFSEMQKYRLSGASHQVFGDLMAARMKSVSHNRKVKIFFVSDYQYNICDDSDQNGTVDNCEGTPRIVNIQNNYNGVTVSSNNNPIFHPRGTASNLATVSIANSSGTKTITVAITGRVRLN